MQVRRSIFVTLTATALALSSATPANAYDRLVVFGDSLSDTGNIYTITDNWLYGWIGGALTDLPLPYPPPPYYQKRFSDGPIWIDHLAGDLSVAAPQHDLRNIILPVTGNGDNYAVGGALTSPGPDALPYVDMDKQLARYLDNRTPTGNELFVVFGGANNINDAQSDVGAIANDLTGYITALYNAGARHVLVSNLPPLGQTPGNKGTSDEAIKDQLALNFNATYAAALDTLESTLPQLDLHRMDFHRLTQDLLGDPTFFGFNNITDPALNEDTLTIDPTYNDDFAFWDDIHPSKRFHTLMADAAMFAMVGALAGDANNDGVVDAADYLTVEHFMGDTGEADGFLWGDANDDGRVDGDDWLAVEQHFGATWATAGLVPEPATAGMLAGLIVAITTRRRRGTRT